MREKTIEYVITLLFIALMAGCIYEFYTFCIAYNITVIELGWFVILFTMFIGVVILIHDVLDDLNVFATIKKFIKSTRTRKE